MNRMNPPALVVLAQVPMVALRTREPSDPASTRAGGAIQADAN